MIEMFRQNWRWAAGIAAVAAVVGAFTGVAVGTYATGAIEITGDVVGAILGAFLAAALSIWTARYLETQRQRSDRQEVRRLLASALKRQGYGLMMFATQNPNVGRKELQKVKLILASIDAVAPTLTGETVAMRAALHRLSAMWPRSFEALEDAMGEFDEDYDAGAVHRRAVALGDCIELARKAAAGQETEVD